MIISIYTDGSHLDKQNGGRLGCGGVMVDTTSPGNHGKLLGEFSEELTPEWLKKNIGTDKVSNPTAELIGVLYAIQKFKIPAGTKSIIIYADYIGVKEWMNGKWKTKEAYIKKVKDEIEKELAKTGLKRDLFKFEWVKGHQKQSTLNKDAYWNDYVDKLAKGEV